jgi:hypothetical protein
MPAKLHLVDARLCVACDMIHDQDNCPSCTSRSCLSLRDLLNRRQQRMGTLVEVEPKGAELPVRLVVDEPAA